MRSVMRVMGRRGPSSGGAAPSATRSLALVTLLTLLAQGCVLAQGLLLTAALGPADYGVFGFALTLQSYLFLFSCLGVRPVTVREGTQRPDELDAVLTSYLVITGALSGLLCAGTVAAARLAPLRGSEHVLLAFLAAGNIAASTTIIPLFDVHHRQPSSACVVLAAELLAVALTGGLFWRGQLGLGQVGAVFAGKWAVSWLAHLGSYHSTVRPIRLSLAGGTLWPILRSSWPLTFSNLVGVIPFTAGVFFVRAYHGDARVAPLALGQQGATAFLMLAALGIRVLLPHLAGPRRSEPAFLARLDLLYGLFVGALFVAAAGAACAVVWFILDPRYRDALPASTLMLGAACLYSLGQLPAAKLVVRREETFVLVANACTALLYLAGCWCVVPLSSWLGAALVSGGASAFRLILLAVRLRRLSR